MEKRVAIFCASSSRIDPAYGQAARALVRGLHALGWTVVSGGGERGTMGEITDESYRCGGRHVGVLPRFMAGWESPRLSEVIWTDTMALRKEKMRARWTNWWKPRSCAISAATKGASSR